MLNGFYKKRCQEKTSTSTGGREDCCLEIQPTDCKRAPRFAREVLLWLFAIPVVVHLTDGDDANRVWKLGKRVLVSSVSTMVL